MARGNGEGTIVERSDGRWMGAVTIGTDPKTGKPKRKYIYGKRRKDVARKMTDLKKKLFDGTYVEPSNMKLKNWLNRWIEGRKNSISTNTYKFYKRQIDCHINPILGDVKLKELKSFHIQELLNDKFEDGRIDGKGGLSETTVGHIYRAIHAGLEAAEIDSLIPSNPCKGVDLPKDEENIEDDILHTWDKDQVNKFLKVVKKEAKKSPKKREFYILQYLALNTGMRQGELLGLQWKDIDFKKKLLEVKRQYGRSMKFKILKSDSARRTIPLSDEIISELNSHKIMQGENKLALGEEYNDNDLVGCNVMGDPITHSQLFKEFKKKY